MPRPVAKCGTDGGYYRHRRHGEPACAECKTAHAVATRRTTDEERARLPRLTCACGRGMRRGREMCSVCTRKRDDAARTRAADRYTDEEHDPKRPVAWRPNGRGIQVPVYESEVA